MKTARILPSVLPILVVCFACAAVKPAPPPSPSSEPPRDPAVERKQEAEALRREAQALAEGRGELYWKLWAEGQAGDAAALEARAAGLLRPETATRLSELASLAAGDEARELRGLSLFVAGELAARAAAAQSEKLAQALAESTVQDDGAEVLLRDLEARLVAEAHPARRRALAAASAPALEQLARLAVEREAAVAGALAALGHPSPLAFGAELRQLTPEAARALAESVLTATEESWRNALAELSRQELKLAAADVRRADLPRLLRTGKVDAAFPAEQLAPRLEALLSGMGLAPASIGLRIDAEPRPRKSPRALALPVRAPGDVRLSLKPAAGFEPFSQALREAGAAVAWSLSPERPFGLSMLDGQASSALMAQLFESLAGAPELAEQLGVPADKVALHSRARALRRLHDLRVEAARSLCELSVGASLEERRRVCAEALGRAWGVALEQGDGDRWGLSWGEPMDASARLRAMVRAGAAEAGLRARLGATWWKDPRAAEELRALAAGAPEAPADVEPLAALLAAQLAAR